MEDWGPTPPPRPPCWPRWAAWIITGSSLIGVLVGVLVALWLVLPRWTGSLLIIGCWLLGAGLGWLALALVCRAPREDNPPERSASASWAIVGQAPPVFS
ncbi:MAG TPA: hypothetical protein VFW96_10520 [Thermomicrobiales bacterium]|nr:hypothetical protein [Thermomicrobiales bacterium]